MKQSLLRQAAGAALDLVWPPLCAGCGEEPCAAGEPLGAGCLAAVEWAAGRDCVRCGRVLGPHAERSGCLDCRGRTLHFRRAAAAARYDGAVAAIIRRMKASREAFWAGPLAEWLRRRLAGEPFLKRLDAVVCVPQTRRGRLARGFNPAGEIARRTARSLSLPFRPDALARERGGRKQSDLPRVERLANPAGLFRVPRGADIEGRTLLLVDDVITTGATVSECARVLRAAGARAVYAAAPARS